VDASDRWRVGLPGVSWVRGARVVGAVVRPLTGHDELAVTVQADRLSAVELGLLIAERCTLSLRQADGAELRPRPETIEQLVVGDREALLLHIRRATSGDRISLVVDCPDPECGEPMDLDLTVSALLGPTLTDPPATIDLDGRTLRRPTGADQLAVATQALDDPAGAATQLLGRCLVAGDADGIDQERAAVVLDEHDPQATSELVLACPACATRLTTVLDAADLLCDELAARGDDLTVAVHLLATQYHWSEHEILALPMGRRRRYVELVADWIGSAVSP
jgi:hypothetical protein